MITLNVKKREKESNEKLREQGEIPAVFYGKKEKSTPISVKLSDFLKTWKEAGESTVITLEGDIGKKDALVHDVDLDPLTNKPRHADFYVFEEGKTLEVGVSLKFVGVSPAVKEMGGTLVKVLHEIEIEAMPKNLPSEIEVDISNLVDFDSQILAKDIKLPEGVTLAVKPEEVIALAEEIKEEIEEVTAQPDLTSIEVEQKGKKDDEGGGDTPAESKENSSAEK